MGEDLYIFAGSGLVPSFRMIASLKLPESTLRKLRAQYRVEMVQYDNNEAALALS